ncbi:MAG: threonine synthase, partial [Halanaerobium sp. MSAO_Bac5]
PHTAVAFDSLNKYRDQSSDLTTAVIDSTASPYKFSRAVLEAIKNEKIAVDEYRIIEELKQLSGTEIHRAIKGLENMDEKHKRNCSKNKVKEELKDILAI